MRAIFAVSLALVVFAAAHTYGAAQSPSPAARPAQTKPTFTKDVAPILQNKCQQCHRPGTFAPMSLVTYEEARPWARSIKAKVVAREMPPFYVDKDTGIQEYENDISLTAEEIATLAQWADSGAEKGDPAHMPPPRTFPDEHRFQFGEEGEPDLVVSLPEP